jgi:DNA polymerase-3 subunit beta
MATHGVAEVEGTEPATRQGGRSSLAVHRGVGMKALCHRESLLAALGVVSGIVPARSPKPLLRNVKLSIGADESATLLATDLEVGIRYRVLGVKADGPGDVILPTQRLTAILRTTTDAELALDADGNELSIRGVRARFNLPQDDPDAFPDVPDFGATAYHVIAAADLRRLIRRTIFSTDVESTRYALGGVLFEFGEGTLTLVGTDGRRLARAVAPAEREGTPKEPEGKPVVPVKALKQIERTISDDDPPVHILIQGTTALLLRTDRAVVFSRLVEGRFPRYQDVFPAHPEVKIELEVGPLLAAVDQASIVTDNDSRGVDFQFEAGTLGLSSRTAEIGSAQIELPIAYDGKPIGVCFDPHYLADALRVLDPAAKIVAELVDSRSAVVFRTEDNYTYVVMPLTRDA